MFGAFFLSLLHSTDCDAVPHLSSTRGAFHLCRARMPHGIALPNHKICIRNIDLDCRSISVWSHSHFIIIQCVFGCTAV